MQQAAESGATCRKRKKNALLQTADSVREVTEGREQGAMKSAARQTLRPVLRTFLISSVMRLATMLAKASDPNGSISSRQRNGKLVSVTHNEPSAVEIVSACGSFGLENPFARI